ncbi:hypothetical protein QR680_018372 [Steinernema hermaphroditum]|uniref:HTH CENPB-type domain-containing protein n=1 Tax=Steinernema hermaphroditum TaxID=289476 RepID=A0AA39HHR3_9BILA|nr:hypothetical protein QR680_018372 [Steinernema hermaphroditum]
MDRVPADFIERAVFLLDDFSPLGKLSHDSCFYTFYEEISIKCNQESALSCRLYRDFVLPSRRESLQRCEENRKYLRGVALMATGGQPSSNSHDNQELEKRVLSLCFFAKEVHLVICFVGDISFAKNNAVSSVKKLLQLNIPVHKVTLGSGMECDSFIDQILKNVISSKSLRNMTFKCFGASSWNFLDGMFNRAEFETLECNVAKLLSMRFSPDQSDNLFTDVEESMCTSIIEYILGAREADESLDAQDDDDNADDVSSDEDYAEIAEIKRNLIPFKYSRTQMEKIVKDYDDNGLSFADIQHQYRMVNSRAEIGRKRKYVNHSVKLEEAEIKNDLLRAFQDWVKNGHHINDRDLHLEALEIARRKMHTNFKASPHFIMEFKKKSKIVSRKITHSATTKHFVDVEHQKAVCQKFRSSTPTKLV